MGTPLHRQIASPDASIRALGYPMARTTVDGCDVVECFETATAAIERARAESLPTLLEFKTYRYRGHSMADPGKYRPKEEVESWKQRDPLILARLRVEQEFGVPGMSLEEDRHSVFGRLFFGLAAGVG